MNQTELFLIVDNDVVYHNRQIYTLLDLLGDIGGLYGTLIVIGYTILTAQNYICGSGLHYFIYKSSDYTYEKKETEDELTYCEAYFCSGRRKRQFI